MRRHRGRGRPGRRAEMATLTLSRAARQPSILPPVSRFALPAVLLIAAGLTFGGPALAQATGCPPNVRCGPDQLPPPRNDAELKRRVEAEEGAAIEAALRQRETAAIRQQEAQNVDAERRAAWIDRGRLKEAPPALLVPPLFTLTPSGRVMGATGKSVELGVSIGLRVDGISLDLGRLAFELEAVLGSRDSKDAAAGTVAGDASVLWIGSNTALPFLRLGTSVGRYFSGPSGATPTGFYRLYIGLGVDNYFIPLGYGRGAGFAFEARAGLFDGYGSGAPELTQARAEVQLLIGPRFAF
jgi:hypothetical protein